MNNSMLAEQQPRITDYPHFTEPEPEWGPRHAARVQNRQKSKRNRGLMGGDWLTVPVLLACCFAFCVVGGFYVDAFANITLQSRQIVSINNQLSIASAEHEALVKQAASLQSDRRIIPLAIKLKMSQVGTNPFIDLMPEQSISRREVASAQ